MVTGGYQSTAVDLSCQPTRRLQTFRQALRRSRAGLFIPDAPWKTCRVPVEKSSREPSETIEWEFKPLRMHLRCELSTEKLTLQMLCQHLSRGGIV